MIKTPRRFAREMAIHAKQSSIPRASESHLILSCAATCLNDHLCNTLAAESLATLKLLTLKTSKRIADGSDHQQDGARNQACSLCK